MGKDYKTLLNDIRKVEFSAQTYLLALVITSNGNFDSLSRHDLEAHKLLFCVTAFGFDVKGPLKLNEFLHSNNSKYFRDMGFNEGYRKINDMFRVLNATFMNLGKNKELRLLLEVDDIDINRIHLFLQRAVPFDGFSSIMNFVTHPQNVRDYEKAVGSSTAIEAEVLPEISFPAVDELMQMTFPKDDTMTIMRPSEDGAPCHNAEALKSQNTFLDKYFERVDAVFTQKGDLKNKKDIGRVILKGGGQLPDHVTMFLDGKWVHQGSYFFAIRLLGCLACMLDLYAPGCR